MFDRIAAKRPEREPPKKAARQQRKKEKEDVPLRSPIVCVLGHVDTGKTKLLDKIRRTNVQKGEAGGITQQIGATYFPIEQLSSNITKLGGRLNVENCRMPGILMIDTPGHESFTNLRSRGSSLCDFAILVVDLMHGLEKQTLESINLLRQKRTPFIVALNKIDRIFGWAPKEYSNIADALERQDGNAVDEFNSRTNRTIVEFASEESLNARLFWENPDANTYVSLVPTSAITGEGIPDLLSLMINLCQERLTRKISVKSDAFECTVLEVKVIDGHGKTIDVILVNGTLKVGDTIVLSGFNGAIVTTIRALLTPHPMKEIRVKGEYQHHKELQGAMGIKISAPGLDDAIAGSELFRVGKGEDIEEYKDLLESDIMNINEKYVDRNSEGVCVQASTLGSLEALLEFLLQMKIPVCSINIGPVHKKDVLKAIKSLVSEHPKKEYATILAFDVVVSPEASEYAEQNGIKIFTAEIIYHLFDQFKEYVEECRTSRKKEEGAKAVFPCTLEVINGAVFNRKDPILIGVNVRKGVLKVGTPLCVPDKGNLKIGVVDSIKLQDKAIQTARAANGGVSVKIVGENNIYVGRHFDETSQIVSLLTRDSIDSLKEHFRDQMTQDDWAHVIQLKKIFGIS